MDVVLWTMFVRGGTLQPEEYLIYSKYNQKFVNILNMSNI